MVFLLTFIIFLISTLAYTVRVVGIKTGRIAVASSVFNILGLVSSTAAVFQGTLLAKAVDTNIKMGTAADLIYIFRFILISMALAAAFGAFLMPTFIRAFSKAVNSFSVYRSIPRLLIHAFSKSGIEQFKECVTKPKRENLSHLKSFRKTPKKIILLNMLASAISSTGPLAALYAGCLNPDLRATCISLSPVITGFSTILMYIFIDPCLSMMTDDVIRGECSEIEFSRCTIFIVVGLIVGPLLAQLFLVPASKIIIAIANFI
jgi:Protein of unknown function (DUF2837).